MPLGIEKGHTYIIAEAGVNHNGDPELARQLIDAAADAKADAVKFQLFDPDEIASEAAPLAAYQKRSGESDQKAMLRRFMLPRNEYPKLKVYAEEKGLDFITTPFDASSATFLADLGVAAMKIPSGELTNLPFLDHIAGLGIFTIISTGMANMQEVRDAAEIFQKKQTPFALLHCVSAYPAPTEEINLRAMETLKKAFPVPVGYSDHTEGIAIAITAALLGAEVLEKHFTLDRTMQGPDHAASLEPRELKEMIKVIKNPDTLQKAELVLPAIGTGDKHCQPCEEATRDVARRSIVTAKPLKKGDVLREEMLAIKRPGTGIPPKNLGFMLGKTMTRDLDAGALLTEDSLA